MVGPDDERGAPVPETLGGGRVVRRGHQYHGALQLPWLHTFKGAFIRVLNVFVLGGVIVSVGRARSRSLLTFIILKRFKMFYFKHKLDLF